MRWPVLTRALLLYFGARLCFFALAISPAIPPDEATRVGVVEAFARCWWIPQDGPSTWALGAIAGQPYLYDLLLGKWLLLDVLPVPDLAWLRLANVVLAIGTVLYGVRWIDGLAVSPWARALFVVVMTNLLMFTGLSAAVSYDNLVNLLAAMSFFHLFRWLHDRRPVDLVWLCAVLLAGCLTKRTFLPLAAIEIAALVLWHARERGRALRHAVAWRPRTRSAVAGLVGVAVLAVANVALYGGNLVRHQRLVPDAAQVLGESNALRNRVVARNRILAAYREGRISFERALALADRIPHAGDRRSTRALLGITRRTGSSRMSFPAYLASWTRHMVRRTFGYWGHRAILPGPMQSGVAFALLAVAVGIIAARPGTGGPRPGVGFAGLLAAAYAAVLLLGVNYPTYVVTGLPDLAVQGRYLFPVLLPLAGIVAVAWTDRLPRRLRNIAAPAIAIFLLAGDLPLFLSRADAGWFAG